MTLSRLPCPDCDGSGCDVEVPSQVPCRSCGGAGELSRVDDDMTVEAELSSPPAPVPDEQQEWIKQVKEKLDPYERAGVDP